MDDVVVYAGKYWDRELAYVAMSRQRESVQLHWDKETFQNRGALYERLGRSAEKANVQDFADQEREVAKLAREAPRPKQAERLAVLEAEVIEAEKRHVAAEKAWEKFDTRNPLGVNIKEMFRLGNAEKAARAELDAAKQKYLKACQDQEQRRKPQQDEVIPYEKAPQLNAQLGEMAQRSRKQPEAKVPVITQAEIEKARKEAFPVQKQRIETRQEAHDRYLAAMERVAAMPSNAPPEDALAAKRDAAQAKAAHNRHRVHELEASAKVDELIAKVNKLERWERVESPVPLLEREVKRLTETVKAREYAAQRYKQAHSLKAKLGGAKKLDRKTQDAREELAAAEKKLGQARQDPEVLAVSKALGEARPELVKAKETYAPHRLVRMQELAQTRKQEQQRELQQQKQRGPYLGSL